MSASPAPPPVPRPRTINDLPTEIKKYIVDLAAKQDEVYKQWTTALADALDVVAKQALVDQKKRFRSSLRALFCVSKEWSEWAAPSLFRTLKASKTDFNYQVNISPRRWQHIKHLHLDTADSPRLATAIAAATRADKIESLHLHYDALKTANYYDNFSVKSRNPLYNILTTCLSDLAKSVSVLSLHNIPVARTAPLVRFSKILSSLHLTFDNEQDFSIPAFATALSSAAHLQSLRVTIASSDADSPINSLEVLASGLSQRASLPPLRRLTLDVPIITTPIVRFSEVFAPSLHHLGITTVYGQDLDVVNPPRFGDRVFPHLESLTVNASYISDVLEELPRAAFPKLAHVEYGMLDGEESLGWTSEFLAAFGKQLRSLRVHEGQGLDPWLSAEFRETCAREAHAGLEVFDVPNLALSPSAPFFFTPSSTTSNFDGGALNRAACRPYVRTLLDFLAGEVAQAERNNDDASFAGLVSSLKALELERVARTG